MKILKICVEPHIRKNLLKLADYLESLPADYKHFDMSSYIENSKAAMYYAKTGRKGNQKIVSCGTVACAVGHGPAAGISIKNYVNSINVVDWSAYADEQFSGDDEFDWLFGSIWTGIDNHHWGAAARIRFMLDKGGIPEEFWSTGSPESKFVKAYQKYRVDNRLKAQINALKKLVPAEVPIAKNDEPPHRKKQLIGS